MRSLLVLLFAGPLALSACTTTEGGTRASHSSTRASTQGVIVMGTLEDVWFTTRQAVSEMGAVGTDFDSTGRSLETTVRGTTVNVRVEPFDAARTIVHVTGSDPGVVQDVQLAVQRQRMR